MALNPLINLLTEKGIELPTAEQIKNNIHIHNIGSIKKAKQVFHVEANMARLFQGYVKPLKQNQIQDMCPH